MLQVGFCCLQRISVQQGAISGVQRNRAKDNTNCHGECLHMAEQQISNGKFISCTTSSSTVSTWDVPKCKIIQTRDVYQTTSTDIRLKIPACFSCHPTGMHTPAQHISESWNSAEFYANKLLKEIRGVDENQVNWVKALKVGDEGWPWSITKSA